MGKHITKRRCHVFCRLAKGTRVLETIPLKARVFFFNQQSHRPSRIDAKSPFQLQSNVYG
jgi:hypothetical protein